jgi:predicted PurR-regulated permease PerM
LAGVLTAVCAIIPYVGAFISFGVCVFLTVLIDPMLGLKCAIVYLVVQFVENQFIYPKVVGTSVGLPPIYTLISALIGGKLFGIMGILFFIPIAAVVFDIVSENADKKLYKKFKEVN